MSAQPTASSLATTVPSTSPLTPIVATKTAAEPYQTGWPATITLGLFAGDDSHKVLESYAPLAEHLSKLVGIGVKTVAGTSYGAVIEAMRTSQIDAMEIAPFAYILAAQEGNVEAIAAVVSASDTKNPVYDASAKPYYHSVIFTKQGNGITTLSDLKGRTFSFVDPASTSGHLIPTALLMKNGINPATDLTTIYVGSHRSSVLAVGSGQVAAGSTNDQSLQAHGQQGQTDVGRFSDTIDGNMRTADEIKTVANSHADEQLMVLATSEPIPNTPFAVRATLPKTLKAALKTALLEVKQHPAVIRAISGWYVEATPEWTREFC